ncbi:sugar transferase [Actinomyces ruminicola]|nr:sugar transferase [Actinomyces ruminicola]
MSNLRADPAKRIMAVMPPWKDLPEEMRTHAVRPYYDRLVERQRELRLKRLLDIAGAAVMLAAFGWLFAFLPIIIKIESPGPVFFRQKRVTQFGREFEIHKFRTMKAAPHQSGLQVTLHNDARVTRVGAFLRRYRIDEVSQLIDILQGNMSFVGTRPEVPEYVRKYTPEMLATLLLPAGVTSTASIEFKDEAQLLTSITDAERAYTEYILPRKMAFNLDDIRKFSIARDLRIMLLTIRAVLTDR